MPLSRYLVFNAFVSGAVIMVIELLGSRIIGPPFGVSLFVWTSLITVTLVSLALGYWLGGRLADRKNSHSSLFSMILLAGLWVAAIPLVKGAVIEGTLALGLRLGSLACSTALFGPPLFLLGMVSPYTVKLYMSDTSEVGRTVGWLYAVSTCGSFLGTVLTGFILIPMIGVNNITYLSALVLISLSAGYWAIYRKRVFAAAATAVPVALLLFPQDLPSIVRPDGTVVTMLVNKDSAYGQIKVVDYSYGDERLREFLLENMIQGAIEVNTGLPISKYTYYVEQLARTYSPEARRALVIGLGSGIIPSRFAQYGISTDVVEINPGVVEAARSYFSYDPLRHPTFVEDGRNFLKSPEAGPYDIIFLDAFSGDTPPSHLVSVESFELAKQKLAPGGVLIINFVAGNTPEDLVVPSSLNGTLGRVFRHVDIYADPDFFKSRPTVVNMIFVARDSGAKTEPGFVPRDAYSPFIDDLRGLYSRQVELGHGPFVFTDDYNPIDFYDLSTRERFRERIISSSDREIVAD